MHISHKISRITNKQPGCLSILKIHPKEILNWKLSKTLKMMINNEG